MACPVTNRPGRSRFPARAQAALPKESRAMSFLPRNWSRMARRTSAQAAWGPHRPRRKPYLERLEDRVTPVIINGGFEMGLTGWSNSPAGSAAVVSSHADEGPPPLGLTYTPQEGKLFAVLTTPFP